MAFLAILEQAASVDILALSGFPDIQGHLVIQESRGIPGSLAYPGSLVIAEYLASLDILDPGYPGLADIPGSVDIQARPALAAIPAFPDTADGLGSREINTRPHRQHL